MYCGQRKPVGNLSAHLAATPSKTHVTFPPLRHAGTQALSKLRGEAEILTDPMDSLRQIAQIPLAVLRR